MRGATGRATLAALPNQCNESPVRTDDEAHPLFPFEARRGPRERSPAHARAQELLDRCPDCGAGAVKVDACSASWTPSTVQARLAPNPATSRSVITARSIEGRASMALRRPPGSPRRARDRTVALVPEPARGSRPRAWFDWQRLCSRLARCRALPPSLRRNNELSRVPGTRARGRGAAGVAGMAAGTGSSGAVTGGDTGASPSGPSRPRPRTRRRGLMRISTSSRRPPSSRRPSSRPSWPSCARSTRRP